MAAMKVLTLVAAVAASIAPAANAHGWINRPAARQVDCNGKGLKGAVYTSGGAGSGDKAVPLGGMPDFCGDPFMDKMTERWGLDHWTEFDKWECAPQETYTEGGVLDMEFLVSAPHGGFVTCNICEGDSTAISEECFEKNRLLTVENNSERWYMMEGGQTDEDDLYQINWKIPTGLSCDHCVLMCTWWTAHHCTFPCDREICGIYADGFNPITRPGDTDNPYPECDSLVPEFGEKPQIYRNCADIKINPASGPTDSAPWVRPPYPDSPDCGKWIQDYEWHSDGDLDQKTTEETEDDCIAACDAYTPTDGSLPCNAVSYYTDNKACMLKNVGQYWVINGPFEDGNRKGWQRCENGQSPPSASDTSEPTASAPAPEAEEEEEMIVEEEENDDALYVMNDTEEETEAPLPAEEEEITQVTPPPPTPVTETPTCGDNCCPSDAPDCLCGTCGTLPPGQVISCAEDSDLDCCNADPENPCATESPAPMAMPSGDEEIESTVGGAGDMMHCKNEMVGALLTDLNGRREKRGNAALECDEKATGAAVNWSEMMCNAGAVSSDKADNCKLAGFSTECDEVVNVVDDSSIYALRGMKWNAKAMLYKNRALNKAGMGYFECDDGKFYWTVLADGDGTSDGGTDTEASPPTDSLSSVEKWYENWKGQQK